jgi:hypothetical protein
MEHAGGVKRAIRDLGHSTLLRSSEECVKYAVLPTRNHHSTSRSFDVPTKPEGMYFLQMDVMGSSNE